MSKFPDSLTNLVQFDGQTYMAPEFGKWGSYLYDQQYLEQQGSRITTGHVGRGA